MNWIFRHQHGYKSRNGNSGQTCGAGLQIHGERCMMLGVVVVSLIRMRILSTGNKIRFSGLRLMVAVLRSRFDYRSLMLTHKTTLHPKHLCAPHDQNGQRSQDALVKECHGEGKMRAGPALFNVIFCWHPQCPFRKCRRQDSNLH